LFKQQGASIVIVGRDLTTLESTRKELGGNTLAVQADVSKIADIEDVMAQVREKFDESRLMQKCTVN